jgi:hypothetical protein
MFSKFSSCLTLQDRGRKSSLQSTWRGGGIDDQLNGFCDSMFAVVGGDVREKGKKKKDGGTGGTTE